MTAVTRFRSFVVAVDLVALGVALLALRAGDAPVPWLAVAVFGAMTCTAEHFEIRMASSTSVSAGSLPAMAGVFVCATYGSVVGAVCIGVIGAVHWNTLRAHKWANQCFAAGVFAIASAIGAVIVMRLDHFAASSVLGLLAVGFLLAVVFIALNITLVVMGVALDYRVRARDVLAEMLPSVWHILPFGVLGAVLGRLYLDLGPVVVVLFIAPIFIARQAFASYLSLKEQQEATVRTLIGALEAKDRYTAGHAERVAKYAQYVGQEMRFNARRLERLRFAALMHDVGKLVVPNHLLNKPGRLTEAEFAEVKRHEHVSVEILTRIDFLAPVAPAAAGDAMRYRPDASEAPIEPFIVAAADAYDAMTSSRSYRRALPQAAAFDELRRGAGTQFHPEVVDLLIGAIERRGERHGDGFEEDVIHLDAPRAGTGSAGLGNLAKTYTPPKWAQ